MDRSETNLDSQKIKGYCMVSAFTVVLYLGLSNLHRLSGLLSTVIGLLTPFIIGLVIAFILDGVVMTFEKLFKGLAHHQNKKLRGLARPLSILCTYLLMAAGISVLVTVVVPQLATSLTQLGNSIPGYLISLQQIAERLSLELNLDQAVWDEISQWFNTLVGQMLAFIPQLLKMVPQMLDLLASVGGGVFNFVIGLIVSIYLLLSKEKLLSQLSRLNRAFLPEKASGTVAETAKIASQTFSNYVTGQLLDALIVGVVSVIGLTIFRFPYAMLIGVVMGITNVIPFFGPFIGAVPGVIIIFMVSPVRALWYILFVVVVQQIDGNILAPRIIGNSVGLSPIWVLFAVTVGGGLFGVPGMVLGTPVFAIVYILIGRATRKREAQRAHGEAPSAPEEGS
ncbi:AI-2E family transporter [Anaerotruncus rubiinfantis]|uniref:AI-2E family transporter n=1 Tax=Anaerotruncus rubiinfantis TaxID=1720200 RepID=UPI0034A3567A